MKYLSNEEEKKAIKYMNKAVKIALSATCLRGRRGAVIVKDNKIIGTGFNSPPSNKESQKRCLISKNSYHEKITDKTCCIHAEQRAIMDALKRNPEKIINSRLYFVRLDENGNKIGIDRLYCTICSKMALDVGITELVLWHEEGICVYDTEEYNTLSFQYKQI